MGIRLPLLVFLLPTLTVGLLWLASGRERLTKNRQLVTVVVADDVWGAEPQHRWQPGPIFGYYIGLIDCVLPTTAGAAALAIGVGWYLRRRAGRRVAGGA